MLVGYARVSTKGQARDGNSLEVQEKLLKESGCERIFSDACSGVTTQRPQFELMLSEIKEGDTLVVTKLDRFARSVSGGLEIIEMLLKEKKVKVHVLNIGILDDTVTGRLIRNIFLAFAEFEHDMILMRTEEGKAIARQNPDYEEGRKPKYTKAQLQHAMELKKTHSFSQTAELTGISVATLKREAAKSNLKSEI